MTSPALERERFERAVREEAEAGVGGPLAPEESWFLRWVVPAITLPWFYVAMPRNLRSNYRLAHDGGIRRMPAGAPVSAPDVPPEADAAVRALEPEGFAVVADVVERGPFGAPVRLRMLGHAAEPHGCHVVAVGSRGRALAVVVFDTEWRDGTRTVTWTGAFSPSATVPGINSVWIRDARDAAELLGVHRRRCADRRRAGAEPIAAWRDDPLATLARTRKAGIEASVRAGRLEPTLDGSEVRPTRLGALRVAWTNLFPTYHVLRWLEWYRGVRDLTAVREGGAG